MQQGLAALGLRDPLSLLRGRRAQSPRYRCYLAREGQGWTAVCIDVSQVAYADGPFGAIVRLERFVREDLKIHRAVGRPLRRAPWEKRLTYYAAKLVGTTFSLDEDGYADINNIRIRG